MYVCMYVCMHAEGIITVCHLTFAGPKGQMSDQNLVWSDILANEIIRAELNVWQFLDWCDTMSDHFRKVIIPTVHAQRLNNGMQLANLNKLSPAYLFLTKVTTCVFLGCLCYFEGRSLCPHAHGRNQVGGSGDPPANLTWPHGHAAVPV